MTSPSPYRGGEVTHFFLLLKEMTPCATPCSPSESAALDDDCTHDDPLLLLREARMLLRDHRVRVSTRAIESDPVDALVETAKETDAHLIVVGARGDSFVARAVRGSVSERLVARTPCDLFIAR